MNRLFAWLQRVTDGHEVGASTLAVVIVLVGSVVLAVSIYRGSMAVLNRLPHHKERCPGCGRRALAVCWCDEEDEEGAEHAYFRCDRCGARYRQRLGGPWEDASAPEFASMFEGKE
ncbi:hypothetical protein P12x_002828 [Tundrisphaera lichenicola]|uniref:hypothetical protein n=1 Tax=Tundrisphaera lichenicola TaxID=2029860 RepID=UPI003EBD401F